MLIVGILYIWCWKVLSWAIILVAKSARGDCETALPSLLGFLIGFVIADLCSAKTARETLSFGVEDTELWTVTLLPGARYTQLLSGEGDPPLDPSEIFPRGPQLPTNPPNPTFHPSLMPALPLREGVFFPIVALFCFPPPFLFIHQLGPAGSWLCVPLSRFTHFSDTRFQHLLCGTTTYPSIPGSRRHTSVYVTKWAPFGNAYNGCFF